MHKSHFGLKLSYITMIIILHVTFHRLHVLSDPQSHFGVRITIIIILLVALHGLHVFSNP